MIIDNKREDINEEKLSLVEEFEFFILKTKFRFQLLECYDRNNMG